MTIQTKIATKMSSQKKRTALEKNKKTNKQRQTRHRTLYTTIQRATTASTTNESNSSYDYYDQFKATFSDAQHRRQNKTRAAEVCVRV
jgi:hypothetical protein